MLWAAVEAVQRQRPDMKVVIYAEDTGLKDGEIVSKAKVLHSR